MGQIFSTKADRRLRQAGIALLLLAIGLAAWGMMRTRDASAGEVGKKIAQPIPFSHKQHVEDIGIPCATCHATADKAEHAGLPDTSTCLTCHAELFRGTAALEPLHRAARSGGQVAWKSVTRLPEVSRFHHAAHVRAGVSCATCHGPIETMTETKKAKPLTMDWCLDCHRAAQDRTTQSAIRPVSAWKRDLTDCSVCHY